MKNDKGKVRNINTYRTPEELEEDKIFDEEFRRELIRESRQEAWELNHNPDFADLGEAPDLLESTIALIRKTGNWDDEAWKKAILEEGEDFLEEDMEDMEEDFPEGVIENIEESFSEKNSENEEEDLLRNTLYAEKSECLKETSEFLEQKSGENTILEEEKPKRELSQEEVYELLSEENKRAFDRGKRSIKRDEMWARCRGKVKRRAALVIVGVGVLTMTMNGYADPKHILKVWTEITDSGQNIHIDKPDDSYEYQTAEERDIERIKEKLGIKAPQLVYMPEDMNYIDCDIEQNIRYAKMSYYTENDERFLVYATKEDSGAVEIINIDGALLDENPIYIKSLAINASMEKLNSSEEGQGYKVAFTYDNTYYLFVGNIHKSEFIKILEKIIL